MVDGSDDVEFQFSVRGCLEHAGINFNLFDAWAVEFFQGCDDAGFLPGARGPVYEEMREITALCLQNL